MALITHQLSIHARARREKKDGREYLVAPVVAVVEGVLNNHLVTMEEIGKTLSAWEGMPLVIDHPQREGAYISAHEAGIPHYGFLASPSVNGKFKAEAWWDVALLEAAGEPGETIIHNLENGHTMEGSTAYFQDEEQTPGLFNGVAYHAIARNIQPDHYAVLLDGVGACSIRQGCGICANQLVNNEHAGAMVAFFLQEADAQALAALVGELPAGSRAVPPNEMHVTLAYLGDATALEQDGKDQGRALQWMMHFAQNHTLVQARINGLARFLQVQEDGTQALVVLVDAPMLEHWRHELLEMLSYGAELEAAKTHAFTAHITLAYIPANAPMPALALTEMNLSFPNIALAWRGQVTAFALQGVAMDIPQTNEADETTILTPKEKRTVKSALSALARALNIIPKETVMDKNTLIQQLVANERCPLAQTALEKLSLDELQPLVDALKDTPQVNQAAPADLAKTIAEAVATAVAPLTAKVDGLIANQQTQAESEKAQLIAELVANEACPLPETALKKLDLAELQAYAAEFTPADYSARPGLRVHTGRDDMSYADWVKAQNGGK